MYLIWAYHTSEDGEDPANFPQHSKQGVSDVEYEIVPGNLGTTERPSTPAVIVAPTSGAAAVGVNSTSVIKATTAAPKASVSTTTPPEKTTSPGTEKTTVSSQGGRVCVGALSGVLLAATLSFLSINL